METTTNSLITLDVPARCSKADIAALANKIVEQAIENGTPLKTAEGIAVMEKLVKAIRGDQNFVWAVVDELAKNAGKLTTSNGTLIESTEAGVKYDFSHDSEWAQINADIQELTARRKAREAILKTKKSGVEGVDESTGEVIVGANRSSKTTYKITLKGGDNGSE
jgi:hypothetical protein